MCARRLPGFGIEVQPPAPAEVLPRMDVPVFVGFTAAGPLHRPVRVDSAAQFEMIFGADAPLAWDAARGEPAYAFLPPAVRAFFRNGGRRAWIIRVAGAAQTDYFPLTGLAHACFDPSGQLTDIEPAFAPARSEGSWADGLRLSTALLAQAVALTVESLDPPIFVAALASPGGLAVGDLLRITFDTGDVLMCAARSIEASQSLPLTRNTYRVTCDKALWFKTSWTQWPLADAGEVFLFTHSASTPISACVPPRLDSPLDLAWPREAANPQASLDLALAHGEAPPLGALLRANLGGQLFWLRVEEVSSPPASSSSPALSSSPAGQVRVTGRGLWQTTGPSSPPGAIDLAERLSFEVWARAGADGPLRLSDLTFDARHPRCWDALPSDLALFPEINQEARADYADLWREAANPRFPLAGEERPNALFVPIALPLAPDFYLAPDALNAGALTRDGLSMFEAGLFLDTDLAEVGVRDLINEADSLRYQGNDPERDAGDEAQCCPRAGSQSAQAGANRRLTGIHAALELDEATLIVVPDAVQRGWVYQRPAPPINPPPSDFPLRPEWWHFLDCNPPAAIRPVHEPEWGNFLNCDIRVVPAPVLEPIAADALGNMTVRWSQPESGLSYRLQEATRPDYRDAVAIYAGTSDQIALYGHDPGSFYYRVQASDGRQISDWSNGQVVAVGAASGWKLVEAAEYSDAALLAVQHAVLRLCAARADLLALLALPEHYRADDAQAHLQLLTTAPSGFFGPEEARTLSFGALYHPWLIGHEENRPDELRRTPPDGAMAGIFARRALARGAWVAPANEFLQGVVALTPAIDPARWLDLQAAQLNLVRHEPKGFTAMNSDTLSSDEDLRPINVRRLLILLRRLALQLGPRYVFEPNGAPFRRAVQRGFEALLDGMFLRGAFAGARPTEAYQVVTDASLNTPMSVEQGRFIVELRVAPSQPLTFLTLRLVQTGDRTLVTQEV